MESEQATPVDSIKDVVRSSVKVPKFDKHLKKAGGHNRLKYFGNNNKDEDKSLKTLNVKKFLIYSRIYEKEPEFFKKICSDIHHQGMPTAWIPLIVSSHSSQSSILFSKSSKRHPVSRQDECKFLLVSQHRCVHVK